MYVYVFCFLYLPIIKLPSSKQRSAAAWAVPQLQRWQCWLQPLPPAQRNGVGDSGSGSGSAASAQRQRSVSVSGGRLWQRIGSAG